MTRMSFFLSCAVSMAFVAGSAQAMQAGTYVGSSADGSFVSFTVTGSGGVYSLSEASVDFFASCKHPAGTTSEGWGFFIGVPIVEGRATFHSSNAYYDISGVAKFPTNQTMRGTITSMTAVFAPGATPPDAAQFCRSPKQAFSATFQSDAAVAPIVPGTAVALHQRIAEPK